jgi:hypothetical protein
MAKKKRIKNTNVTKTTEELPKGLVISEIRIQSADRNKKDIGSFRDALRAAESVQYPNMVRLYDLYDDIMLDGHLTGIIEKRIEEVLNKNLYFENAGGKKVDVIDDLIESEQFREVVRKLMEAPAYGMSGMEFVPGTEFMFKEIPRKHIKRHLKIISTEQQGEEGISYDGLSLVWVVGKDKDLGYLLKCSPYALWKRGSMADWAQYIEIFGQPVRVVKYDAYDTKTKMELRQVLDESGSSLALMIPKQADFDMKDGKQSNGTGELQLTHKVACDGEMSIIVLGNTETTTSSKSSGYAQSKEHGKQQLQKTKSDMVYVRNLLNSKQFLDILRSYGYPVEGGRFKFEKEIDLEELKTRMEIDTKLDEKVPLDPDYWYETYGVSKPANFDALMAKREADKQAALAKPQPAPAPPAPKAKNKKPNLADDQNFWLKLRANLADFFDPAP